LAYHKASLVKVVGVVILDAILGYDILYKAELAYNYIWILTEGSLIVVLAIKLHFELWLALNKRTGPVYANMAQIALSAQRISYISHSCKARGKSSRN
jgi:hypothetical protein